MCQCLLIKIVCYQNIVAHQKMYPNHYHVYFWWQLEESFGLQTFVEQLAILVTHHIPAHKSYVMQMKSAHNHTFLHKVRVVNPSIIMQMCDIHFVMA